MGGSSRSQSQTQPLGPRPTLAPAPEYFTVSPDFETAQPAAPGQLEEVAAQLAKGFGGDQDGYLGQMNAYYEPMNVPDWNAGHDADKARRQAEYESALTDWNARAAAAPVTAPSSPLNFAVPSGNPYVYNPIGSGGPY